MKLQHGLLELNLIKLNEEIKRYNKLVQSGDDLVLEKSRAQIDFLLSQFKSALRTSTVSTKWINVYRTDDGFISLYLHPSRKIEYLDE
jgi:hypothetical protein